MTNFQAFRLRYWAIVAVGVLATVARAENPPADPVVRIEEEWEFVVRKPDSELTAPQVITAITPLENLAGVHATFEINHLSSVDFATGGLHLSTWCGETHLAVRHAGNFASMYTEGEMVRWKQVMSLDQGRLVFEIKDGQSTTWGPFGGDDLKLDLGTTLENLNGYSPATSARWSEVSFSGNRVQTLVLKKVRYVRASGNATVDDAPRFIHQAAD